MKKMTSVLIVDDAAFARRMLRKMLQVDGYEILEASNGQEGLDMVRSHTPDCVLTDILMPDVDGFAFLQMLQESGITVPTIIVSADIQDAARDRGMKLGAYGFLNKPLKEDEVRQAVRQACGGE
jgi:CheY-like chemotaxis protein